MGYIIVIEGTDGCGKQTQTSKLFDRLVQDGYNVKRQSFPNYASPSSEPVKMYLGGELCNNPNDLDAYQTSALYAVDRLCTYHKDLKEFYENDGVLVFDRYVESNMLHQAGKIQDIEKREKFLSWLYNFEFNELRLPKANHVIFLDIPPYVSMKLANARTDLKVGKAKDIHEQDPEHLINAYNAGQYVVNKYNWTKVNCMDQDKLKSIDEISDEIYTQVLQKLKNQQ